MNKEQEQNSIYTFWIGMTILFVCLVVGLAVATAHRAITGAGVKAEEQECIVYYDMRTDPPTPLAMPEIIEQGEQPGKWQVGILAPYVDNRLTDFV